MGAGGLQAGAGGAGGPWLCPLGGDLGARTPRLCPQGGNLGAGGPWLSSQGGGLGARAPRLRPRGGGTGSSRPHGVGGSSCLAPGDHRCSPCPRSRPHGAGPCPQCPLAGAGRWLRPPGGPPGLGALLARFGGLGGGLGGCSLAPGSLLGRRNFGEQIYGVAQRELGKPSGSRGAAHPVPSPGSGTYPIALRARPAAGSPLLLARLQGGKRGVRVLGSGF